MSEIKPVFYVDATTLRCRTMDDISDESVLYYRRGDKVHDTDVALYPESSIEALQKENAELKAEDEISAAVIEKCCNLLAQIAITLKGEPEELTRHGYHDLPELVSVLHVENELNKARIEDLVEDLQFVERWANHHGTKPNVTAQEALSCIQHYPSIAAVTKSYKDGVIPDTRNPYAEIEALKSAKTNVIRALGGRYKEIIELRKHNASQTNRIFELEAAVKANHEWHQEHDDYDGYQESELCTTNTAALAASKNGESK